MIKSKTFWIFAAVLFFNFCWNNPSFAAKSKIAQIPIAQANIAQTCYPDYSYEFCGKDKCENFNRKMFIFNSKLNKCVVRPVNTVWASIVPKYGMDKIQNAFTNIEYPIRLMSCLLQKDFKSSGTETLRFLTNTTLGLGGLYDPAKTRFKIEPRQEDMGQALAHLRVKQGPYLVLPIVASGNIRDLAGKLLDCPLNPSSYIIGPIPMIAKSISVVNKTTYMQTLIKAIDYTYADPYEITKQLQSVERYIKNANLDRKEVFAEKTASQNIIKISNVPENSNLKPDIKLNNYNPQGPLVDSMRTALFEDKTLNDPRWLELSVWNKTFGKKIKTSSVNIEPNRPNYNFRYVLQKDKSSPLAILYPSIGEGIMSHHPVVMAKILYDEGYSVVIQGSPFQWEFVKSMPVSYKPGLPYQDAKYLRMVTSKIINNLQDKNGYKFGKKVLIGTSFGALTSLFLAEQEESNKISDENVLDISKYIAINPPINLFFAQEQVDKYAQDWKNNPDDIKMRTAITAEKVIQVSQKISDENVKKSQSDLESEICPLPFTDEEAKMIIGFILKQKLSDLVFTLENTPKSKKCELYKSVNNMSFDDYAQKYLQKPASNVQDGSLEKLYCDTSLYSLANFLQNNEKYRIYHSVDDYFVSPEQLIWLKKQTKDKSVFFSNGSHLGFLYRKEFIDQLKKDVALQDVVPQETMLQNVLPKKEL